MLDYVVAVLVGLLSGVAVNVLSDKLPGINRFTGIEDEPDESKEQVTVSAQWLKIRYVLVEIVLVVAAVYIWGREDNLAMFAVFFFYLTLFTLIAVIDIEHKLILDIVMIPAFIIAFLEVALSGRIKFGDALQGYAAGQILIMALYLLAQVYLWIVNTSRENPVTEVPFGFGDVTLITFGGFVIGFPNIIFGLVLMIFLGGVIAILFTLVRLIIFRNYKAHIAIPYGPAILLALTVLLLWWPYIIPYMLGAR